MELGTITLSLYIVYLRQISHKKRMKAKLNNVLYIYAFKRIRAV